VTETINRSLPSLAGPKRGQDEKAQFGEKKIMLTVIPNGLDEIIHTYGSLDDPQFESRHIVLFQLPYPLVFSGQQVTRARCHNLAVDNFVQAFKNVDAAGLRDQFREFDGIYNRRPIRGQPSHPSLHSWGVAMDMGAATHQLGSAATWPPGILEALGAAGFFWGGRFKARKDPMHFQLATGY